MYSLIVAINNKRGIGLNGEIPWKPDFFFLKKTLGKRLLVGKNTKLPNLPHREVIVANHQEAEFDYVIGGAKLYASYINGAKKIYVSNIDNDIECDTFFPEIPKHFIHFKTKSYKGFTVDIYKNIQIDFDYLKLARKALYKPQTCQLHFDIADNLMPIISSKKIFLRGVIEELLFFLRGETNTKILEAKGINIWRANTTREYLNYRGLDYPEGEAGPIYGAQWVKQFDYVFNELKKNPASRRAIFSAWIPEEIDKMCLPPCHLLYQLSIDDGYLNISMYQRSADILLGLPFNLASCGFMCIIFAKYLGIKPGRVTISIGNAHVYKEHVDAMNQQFKQKIYEPATVTYEGPETNQHILEYLKMIKYEDFKIQYKSSAPIKAPIIVF